MLLSKTGWLLSVLGGIWGLLSIGSATADEAPAGTLERFQFEQPMMGTIVSITVYAPDEPSANTASDAAFSRMQALVDIMSDYEADSEVRRLCAASGPGNPIVVSDELWVVLKRSLEVAELSEGAFDITIGPCVELWRDARRRHRMPLPEQLSRARERVGWQMVQLDEDDQTVELARTDMRIDLGGIAKGYIADQSLHVLAEHGLETAIVAIGGDIVCGTAPPDADGWRIGIAPLGDPEGTPEQFLILENAAVSTAGDAYRFIEIDGVRYSHLIDPATGVGVTRSSSVTVIAPDGLTTDPWDSAISILGPERGLSLVEGMPEVEACIVFYDPDTNQPVTIQTPGFNAFVEKSE